MDPIRIFFNSLIEHVYGEKKKYLNTDVIFEDLYLELCEAHTQLTSLKTQENYPVSLFDSTCEESNCVLISDEEYHLMTYHMILRNSSLKGIIEHFEEVIVDLIFPGDFSGIEKTNKKIITACFDVYFIEDILKHNNREIIIMCCNVNWAWVTYDVKKDIEFEGTFEKPENKNNIFDVSLSTIYDLCVEKNIQFIESNDNL